MPIKAFFTAMLGLVGDQWKIIASIIFILFIMVGFDFRTPAHQFGEVAKTDIALARSDSLINTRIDAIEAEQRATRVYLRALSIAQCLDRPRRETLMMGLRCDELVNGQAPR